MFVYSILLRYGGEVIIASIDSVVIFVNALASPTKVSVLASLNLLSPTSFSIFFKTFFNIILKGGKCLFLSILIEPPSFIAYVHFVVVLIRANLRKFLIL